MKWDNQGAYLRPTLEPGETVRHYLCAIIRQCRRYYRAGGQKPLSLERPFGMGKAYWPGIRKAMQLSITDGIKFRRLGDWIDEGMYIGSLKPPPSLWKRLKAWATR